MKQAFWSGCFRWHFQETIPNFVQYIISKNFIVWEIFQIKVAGQVVMVLYWRVHTRQRGHCLLSI